MASKMKSRKRVHIFSVGEWNGQTFNTSDLDEMANAFQATKNEWQPPGLKLGHDEKQLFLQEEGLPSAGWVDDIYREGDNLYADFVDIPDKIDQLIDKKAYRRVSIEKYKDVKFKDKVFKHMIGAVALLGADFPGVMNLKSILDLYNFKDRPTIKSQTSKDPEVSSNYFSIEINEQEIQEDKSMTEAELKAQLEIERQKREAAETEAKKFKADAEAEKSRADQADQEKAKLESEKAEFAKKAKDAELEKQVDLLVGEKLITKGMRPFALAFLGEEKEKFSIQTEDKKTVELSKFELLKEMATLFSKMSDVNLDEGSQRGKENGKNEQPTNAEVEKYAAENKVTFSEAARELIRKSLAKENDVSVGD